MKVDSCVILIKVKNVFINVQVLDFPGGKVAFTHEIQFISESNKERVPCYRVLDDNGQQIPNSHFVQVERQKIKESISSYFFVNS